MYLTKYNDKLIRKEEKEQLTTINSYNYWCNMLFEKSVRIFEWHNLPFPQKEIETRLIYDGYCGFVKDDIKGLMVASGSMSGVTEYFDEFTEFTYASPTARGGSKKIGKECVIINNNSIRNSLYPLICRYASMLAHTEVTLKCALLNARYTDVFSTDSQGTAESIKAFHQKIYDGEEDVIVDDSLISSLENKANANTKTSIKEILETRNEILKSFYNEIGVRYMKDKKERMVVPEVDNDAQMLLLNIKDMERERKKAVEEINKIFGTNIEVHLSKEFSMILKDCEECDNED